MEGHVKKAEELFLSGCNCAQAVFAAFTDVTGMDEDTALMLASSFGGGCGRLREVCGACSGLFMIAGLLRGYGKSPQDGEKKAHYELIQRLAAQFREENGSIICRELLKNIAADTLPVPSPRTEEYYNARPCIRFVSCAARLAERELTGGGRDC